MQLTTLITLIKVLSALPIIAAAPASQSPVFLDCSKESQTTLRTAISDAIDLSTLSVSAFDLSSGRINPQISTVGSLTPENAATLIARWFGEDAVPRASDTKTAGYVRGVFERMRTTFMSGNEPFRCISNCTGLAPGLTVGFGGIATIDAEKGIAYEAPAYNGVNLCPVFLRHAELYDTHPWYLPVRNWSDEHYFLEQQNFLPSAQVIMHEMAHLAIVSGEHGIHDMCIPGSDNMVAYGGMGSQVLAWQDTNLALHNADNYAGFAVEVGLSKYLSFPPPPPPLEDITAWDGSEVNSTILEKMGWTWRKPEPEIASLVSLVEKFETFPTSTATWSGYAADETMLHYIRCSEQ